MLLSEDTEVVEALGCILKDYNYLEYDEETSKRINALRVRVTDVKADRDISVAVSICKTLEKATGRRFFVPSVVNQGSQDWTKEWTNFNLREPQFHKNVKITYPGDKRDPVVVECYLGEHMNLFVGDPQLTQYVDENEKIKINFRVVDRETGVTISNKVMNIDLDLFAKTATKFMAEFTQ